MANNFNILDQPGIGGGEIVITEHSSGGAGTYTGSITVPGGATMTSLSWSKIRDFGQTPTLIIGDSDDPDGFVQNGHPNSYPDGKTADVFGGNYPFDVSDAGLYVTTSGTPIEHRYSATDHEILISMVVPDPTDPPNDPPGILRILITWAKFTPLAATFEAA